jgi:O-antigen/teichoic acid export membrane protein
MSVPQTLLYFALVPLYETTGAALGYTIGCIAGCIVSVLIAKKIGLHLFWKELGVIFIVSTSFSYILSSIHLNYIPGILLTIALSYLLLLKINIVTKKDVIDFLEILPEGVANPILKFITKNR